MTVTTKASKGGSLQVTDIAVEDLKEYENNPRKNDAQVPRMVDLIEKFGFRVPILVRGTTIVDGHLRIKAARQMGLKTVPAIDVGDMPKANERALRIALNRSVEWSDWDEGKLADEFKAISEAGLDLDLTAFGQDTITRIMSDAFADDTAKKVRQQGYHENQRR